MKATLFLFLFVLTNILTGQAFTPIAARPTDTVKVYTPTLMFDKDTVLPTINIFSKKENTESIILIIVSGDTLADPLSKMVAANAHGSMYAYVGKNHLYNNHCYVLVNVQMPIFKKMSTPKRSFKIMYPNEGASINSKDRFKPNLTTIPINIINE